MNCPLDEGAYAVAVNTKHLSKMRLMVFLQVFMITREYLTGPCLCLVSMGNPVYAADYH